MKKAIIALFGGIFLCCFSINSYGQCLTCRMDKIQVGIHVTSLLDPGYQRAKAELAWKLKPKIQLMTGGAYCFGSQSLFSFSNKKLEQKAWELFAGVRVCYRDDLRKKKSSHLEAEMSYFSDAFLRLDDWYYQGSQYLQFSGALGVKKSWRLGLHMVKQKEIGKKLYLRWHYGLSLRANNLHYTAFETVPIDKPLVGDLLKKFDRKQGWSVGVIPILKLSLSWQPFIQTVKIR